MSVKSARLVVPPARKDVLPAPDVNLDNPEAVQFMEHGAIGAGAAAETAKPPASPNYPWEGKNPAVIKPYLLRLPETLHTMLEFLGETTYKESMHSIALKAVLDVVVARMAERGVPEDQIRAFLPK